MSVVYTENAAAVLIGWWFWIGCRFHRVKALYRRVHHSRQMLVMGAGTKVLTGCNYFSTDPLFLGRRTKCKISPMWDCLVLTASILSLIYLVTLQLRFAKWNPTETT
jgi:hypothetical protein